MPRLQILELPTVYREHGDDETPFALVIDQADDEILQTLAYGISVEEGGSERPLLERLKEHLGARAILVFPSTVEIPANAVTLMDGQVVRIQVDGDFTKFRDQAEQEIRKAQAGLAAGHPS